MSLFHTSIVASGHQYVSEAAGIVLENGGNAFDAVVAAGFASAVAEPALTSLGGGGFLLAHSADHGDNVFFDFFVDVPGKGIKENTIPGDFFPVTVNFSGTAQDFHVGLGSVAVPGTLKGLLHVHNRLGKMSLADVIAPAKELAKGHLLNDQQAHFLKLLRPIMTMHERGRQIFEPDGQYLESGATIANPVFVQFLDHLPHGGLDEFYQGEIAHKIDAEMRDGGGVLTYDDLSGYTVYERDPLAIPYRDKTLLSAPESSMGGTLIGLYFSLLQKQPRSFKWGSREQILSYRKTMMTVEKLRHDGITSPDRLMYYMQNGSAEFEKSRTRTFVRGTTHVSVADRWGNCASMTSSNGEGSGYFVPGTGVMLNNMMGEDDLHPEGFHTGTPGKRVLSMMSPSLLLQEDSVQLVIGSGGSKRIRTAVSQVLEMVVDHGATIREAVDAPRLYLDEDVLQIEPGFDLVEIAAVAEGVPVNVWPQKDVYFGGVHCVIPGKAGAGDSRRGGSVVSIEHA